MTYTRWYDKDEKLKLIVQFLECLDEQTKHEIANDLIQLILDYKKNKSDDMIELLDQNYVEIRNRWYDKTDDLHFAIELLKQTTSEERHEIIRELMYSLLYFKNATFNGIK